MGCDIHMRVEYQPRTNGNNEWSKEWFSADLYKKMRDNTYQHVPIFADRDYDLFTTLAGVRNYHENKFICEPKGIPADACADTLKDIEEWGGDGHSHSYFTLTELKEWQAQGHMIKEAGLMTLEDAKRVDRGEQPNMYWQAGGDPNNSFFRQWTRQNTGLDRLIDMLEYRTSDYLWWCDELTEQHIRIVFWFDN